MRAATTTDAVLASLAQYYSQGHQHRCVCSKLLSGAVCQGHPIPGSVILAKDSGLESRHALLQFPPVSCCCKRYWCGQQLQSDKLLKCRNVFLHSPRNQLPCQLAETFVLSCRVATPAPMGLYSFGLTLALFTVRYSPIELLSM